MSSEPPCTHLDQVEIDEVPARTEVPGCEDCLRMGGRWVHLRVCRTCGKVGCCDSSPNRHASAHAAQESHPIASSIEPGEDWSWCFVDEVAFVLE
jgi:Zn-finger in ubiquitin-hydrolases and other protein